MSLHFLADHCVPMEIVETLRNEGHRVTLLKEVLAVDSSDEVVVARARELNAILLSLNGDFADIVSYPPENYAGIFGIQLHDHPEIIPKLMERLLAFSKDHPEQSFYQGKLFIIEVHRLRIRQ